MSEEKTIEAVQKILGAPVSPEFSETALKVRRNLLVASLIAVIAVAGGVSIDPAYPILGFKFIGLTEEAIRTGLLIVVTYLLLHFGWYVVDEFSAWRLRITGTRVAFVTVAISASEEADYPNDPRQSTLYRWWYEKARHIGAIGTKVEDASNKLQQCKDALKAIITTPKDPGNLQQAIKAASGAQNAIADLKRSIDHLVEIFESKRIPASLERFDRWFEFLLRSDNLRWLLIDAAAPLLAGATAIYFLAYR